MCALLLMGQFLVQLFLIPLGTLFGQIMFIATVLASWVYNTYLSSIDREEIQTQILFKVLRLEGDDIRKYQLGTWTTAVAFACFVLASKKTLEDPLVLLDALLPNNTVVWKAWKKKMEAKLKDRKHFDLGADCVKVKFSEDDLKAVSDEKQRRLLEILFHDVQNAWDAWSQVRDSAQMVALRSREDVTKT
ncbi:hypothetical protein LXA43DRAFT_992271 [Ganoderma leucocontextum]|nr:hypothetical protein LXA43DRAFT_992271 [Ganoderma leucocontextum]